MTHTLFHDSLKYTHLLTDYIITMGGFTTYLLLYLLLSTITTNLR